MVLPVDSAPGIGARIPHAVVRYPLTPILRCRDCGGPMRGHQSGRDGQTLYYACSERRRYERDETSGKQSVRVLRWRQLPSRNGTPPGPRAAP